MIRIPGRQIQPLIVGPDELEVPVSRRLDELEIVDRGDSVRRLLLHIWNMGFDAVRWLWQYFLLGAVIVLPIWFLVRLAKAPRGQ